MYLTMWSCMQQFYVRRTGTVQEINIPKHICTQMTQIMYEHTHTQIHAYTQTHKQINKYTASLDLAQAMLKFLEATDI